MMSEPTLSLALAAPEVPARPASDFPYDHVEDFQNWRKAVTRVDNRTIDPHAATKFRFDPATKFVSAGSCFAQRIAESLQDYGFNYYVVEAGPAWLTREQRVEYNYGVYSARYGNVYTTLQLLQLLQRACGEFRPVDDHWLADGYYVDPFRPTIQPGGFTSVEELRADREQHLALVRQLFCGLDVFIFTLGLTETFCSAEDDAAFPTCPGKRFGHYTPEKYLFRNLTLEENVAYLGRFLHLLGELNPSARVILTVSPVPLAATMESRHIIQSTCYSKAVLRVLAEQMRAQHDNVEYFGSYEIVTATYNNAAYFQDDKRNIAPDGVEHVMWSFYRNFTNEDPSSLRKVERDYRPPAFQVKPCDEEQVLNLINSEFEPGSP